MNRLKGPMLDALLAPRFLVLEAFVASALYVHLRGRVRHTFARQLTDHSTFMAPYNALMYLFSRVPTKPIVGVENFPEVKALRDNWDVLREEAQALLDAGHLKASERYDDLAFNSFFRTGWKRFYLKWYDDFLPSARELCPKSVELVRQVPTINAAMFALLGPQSRLVTHRDPFAGSLRYHLGLITPNSPDCFIEVDGTPYVWKDGEDFVFDETYIHRAFNRTDTSRVILFCDVDRPLRWPMSWVNRIFVKRIAKASATRNVEGEKIGFLNHGFNYVYRVRILFKRLKKWNQGVYYGLKYAGIAGLLYWIFF